MLDCFSFIREMNFLGITLRLVCAMLCGGLIGIEREYKRRPAGFRTHILICLGAAMTTLTSQYMALELKLFTDVARLGAQVIAGIGFIGAGTIIVTNRQRVKGLTTAAGLWTAAIIGLVCGAGYVECALFATAMVLVAEMLLIKIEYSFSHKISDSNYYIEYSEAAAIEQVVRLLKDKGIRLTGLEISRVSEGEAGSHYCAVMTLRAGKKLLDEALFRELSEVENVISLEEL